MTLAAVRPGDIVRVAGSLAEVMQREPRRLYIRWLGTGNSRWAKASEITAHWKRKS